MKYLPSNNRRKSSSAFSRTSGVSRRSFCDRFRRSPESGHKFKRNSWSPRHKYAPSSSDGGAASSGTTRRHCSVAIFHEVHSNRAIISLLLYRVPHHSNAYAKQRKNHNLLENGTRNIFGNGFDLVRTYVNLTFVFTHYYNHNKDENIF